ncbi:restriction endonuclease subunit S [Aliarcobacter cryaerophilus]|uniref:restriction endonuclease subunit S n=1 Tax=Aliarcobacter cryaerophilus TaxID=28198 RepID=UPI003DA30DD7
MNQIKQGYKQTKVGIIPEDWEVFYFDKIFIFSTGKNIKQNEASPDFEIPCVRYGELYHLYNEIITKVINKTNLDKSELLFSKGDEILLPSAGEDPLDIGSASALTLKNIAIGRTINILRPSKKNIYFQKYIAYYINHQLKTKIASLSKGSSISNVYNSDLKKLKIPLPPLKEQEKIAQILTTWDEAITKQTELLRAKELQKKGLMQKLLSGEVRFSEFTDKWKIFSLNEVLKERKTYQSKGLELEHVSLTKEGVVPKSERYERDFLVKGEDKQYKITKLNDICYNPANLKFGVICKNTYGNGIFSPIYVTFETKKGFNIDFLGYFLTWSGFINKVRRFEEGTVYERMAVNPKDFLSFKTKLPSLEEQQKIAEVLSLADDEINLLKNELEELKQQKKALMQKLLTGEVRVKV